MLPPYLSKRLEQLIEEYPLSEIRDQLVSNAETYVNVYLTEKEDYKSVGNSRIAGYPDLPFNIDWPCTDEHYFTFIAQLNLSEIPPHNIDYLPKKGILYFFWGDTTLTDDFHRVIYYDGDMGKIRRTQPPVGLEEFDTNHLEYESYQLSFNLGICLTDAFTENNSFSALSRVLGDKKYEFLEKLYSGEFMLWGQAENYGHDPRAEAYLSQNGMRNLLFDYYLTNEKEFIEQAKRLSGEGYDERAASLINEVLPKWIEYNKNRKYHEEKMKNWHLLLKVPSFISTVHMMWGDAGDLEFFIDKKDIEKLDFSKTGSYIESS